MAVNTPKLSATMIVCGLFAAYSCCVAHAQSNSYLDGSTPQAALSSPSLIDNVSSVAVNFADLDSDAKEPVELCACNCGKSPAACCCNKKKMAALNTAVATATQGPILFERL